MRESVLLRRLTTVLRPACLYASPMLVYLKKNKGASCPMRSVHILSLGREPVGG